MDFYILVTASKKSVPKRKENAGKEAHEREKNKEEKKRKQIKWNEKEINWERLYENKNLIFFQNRFIRNWSILTVRRLWFAPLNFCSSIPVVKCQTVWER